MTFRPTWNGEAPGDCAGSKTNDAASWCLECQQKRCVDRLADDGCEEAERRLQ